ncbi:MAG: alpha/beta fold hydrolase [Deltaproteobacteria bacterium]|nr:alpha/beta fold hydrolase [Deltaproteobacteria bacterium]
MTKMMTTNQFGDADPLPDWLQADLPFRRRFFDGVEYKIHFIDVGDGQPVVLQHGNPTWCFLWRKVIKLLIKEKVRVVAPDLVGLGLSEKPRNPQVHSLAFHGRQISSLINDLDLRDIIVVGQDWGGPVIGLVAATNPERVKGAVFANTAIKEPQRQPRVTTFHRLSNIPGVAYILFRIFNFPIPVLNLIQGDRNSIGPKEKCAYRYPLRTFQDRVAPLALARMVATNLKHPTVKSLKIVDNWARFFQGPVELVWGLKDPILGCAYRSAQELFPQARCTETAAGHYLQEEVPELLAQAILRVVSRVNSYA